MELIECFENKRLFLIKKYFAKLKDSSFILNDTKVFSYEKINAFLIILTESRDLSFFKEWGFNTDKDFFNESELDGFCKFYSSWKKLNEVISIFNWDHDGYEIENCLGIYFTNLDSFDDSKEKSLHTISDLFSMTNDQSAATSGLFYKKHDSLWINIDILYELSNDFLVNKKYYTH